MEVLNIYQNKYYFDRLVACQGHNKGKLVFGWAMVILVVHLCRSTSI